MYIKAIAAVFVASALVGCSDPTSITPATPATESDSCPAPGNLHYGALARLRPALAPQFGINTRALSAPEQLAVRSAWCNFQLALAGDEPNCPEAPVAKDGGSKLYECGPYQVERIDRLAGRNGRSGFEVGAWVSFGPRAELEQVKFVETPGAKSHQSAP